jgi:hypothetical protein
VRAVFTSILAAGVAALTGCGGEDRLSNEEFQERANAICSKYNDEIEAATPSSPEEIEGSIDEMIALIEQGLEELRALNPPEDVEDEYNQMLDATSEGIPAARELGDAAAENDTAGIEAALADLESAGQKSDEIASDLGLDQCASG